MDPVLPPQEQQQEQVQQRNERGRIVEGDAVGVPAMKEGGLSPGRKDQVIACRHCGGKPKREDGKRGGAFYTASSLYVPSTSLLAVGFEYFLSKFKPCFETKR